MRSHWLINLNGIIDCFSIPAGIFWRDFEKKNSYLKVFQDPKAAVCGDLGITKELLTGC